MPKQKVSEALDAKVKAEFHRLVTEQVRLSGGTRWGEKESTTVIGGLFGFAASDEEVAAEGFDAVEEYVALVVNPSSFVQKLEALPKGHPRRVERVKGTRGKRVNLVE